MYFYNIYKDSIQYYFYIKKYIAKKKKKYIYKYKYIFK